MTADYYTRMLDLEGLDPDLRRKMLAWRDDDQRRLLARLFAKGRLDIVQELVEARGLAHDIVEKLRYALPTKFLIFQDFPNADKAETTRLSPRSLAEQELLTWHPESKQTLKKLLAVEYAVSKDWKRRQVNPYDPKKVINFYRRTQAYIWELMAANNLVETLYNYGVTLEKMHRLGISEFLDYGAGVGTFVIAGRQVGFGATYMDLSSHTFEFARWRLQKRRLTVPMLLASGEHNDIPPSQAIVCTEVIEHLSNPLNLLNVFARVIPTGGYLIVSESCRYIEKFASHLPQNRWLGGGRFDYELFRRGFVEVLPEPAVHPRVFLKT